VGSGFLDLDMIDVALHITVGDFKSQGKSNHSKGMENVVSNIMDYFIPAKVKFCSSLISRLLNSTVPKVSIIRSDLRQISFPMETYPAPCTSTRDLSKLRNYSSRQSQ
jgi:hypothetical protein